jgi:hypothetical protein
MNKPSTKLFVLAFAALGALLSASCGSDGDDSGGGASCSSVCACVVSEGGDNDVCQQECAASISAGGNIKQSCELKLDGYGLPQCKSKCAGFPTG